MEMETVAQPQKSDILSASARELTMSDACESSSSYEEEEESEEMMDLSPQSCCQQESLLLHYIDQPNLKWKFIPVHKSSADNRLNKGMLKQWNFTCTFYIVIVSITTQ